MTSIFWLSLAAVAYSYLGYPLLIWLLSRLFGRTETAPPGDDAELPSLSLLIAAYNEEAEIDKRIQNALQLDYPSEKIEIVIASDGSSDQTAAIVSSYADRGVRLLHYPLRRGKASALNRAFPALRNDIVLLSDANTDMDPSAPRRIVQAFADP